MHADAAIPVGGEPWVVARYAAGASGLTLDRVARGDGMTDALVGC